MIPLKWKIWGLVAAAFVFGLLGWRRSAVEAALAEAEAKRANQRLKAISKAKEIREDVESQSDDNLAKRAGKWVRNNDR
jgi:hypothetical protein